MRRALRCLGLGLSKLIQRAAHRAAAQIQDVGVDHRRGHIRVAEQVLHGADVVAVLQKVSGTTKLLCRLICTQVMSELKAWCRVCGVAGLVIAAAFTAFLLRTDRFRCGC